MGEPVKIGDRAEQMIRLSGKHPARKFTEITGLGPGEKQHERLHASDEQLEASTHSKIQRIRGDRLMLMLGYAKPTGFAGGTEWRRRQRLQDTLLEYQAE